MDLSKPDAPVAGTDFGIWDDVGSITGEITQGGYTDDVKPEFKGIAEKDEVIFIYADGDTETAIASIKLDESGEWSWTPETDLDVGEHSYQIAIRDAAGNMGAISEAIEFTVDIEAPQIGTFGRAYGELWEARVAVYFQTHPSPRRNILLNPTTRLHSSPVPVKQVRS